MPRRAAALTLTLLFASVLTVSAQDTTLATPQSFAPLTNALAHAATVEAEPTVDAVVDVAAAAQAAR